MQIKKILATTLALGCLFSTAAIAAGTANHGAIITRDGPYASALAYTSWDVAHCTKVKVGIFSKTASGITYSQTGTVSALGSASSGYWET